MIENKTLLVVTNSITLIVSFVLFKMYSDRLQFERNRAFEAILFGDVAALKLMQSKKIQDSEKELKSNINFMIDHRGLFKPDHGDWSDVDVHLKNLGID